MSTFNQIFKKKIFGVLIASHPYFTGLTFGQHVATTLLINRSPFKMFLPSSVAKPFNYNPFNLRCRRWIENRAEIPPQRSAALPRGWCPPSPSSPVNINLREFLRGGLLFAFEIELCQNKEMREVCREERDEMRWDLGSGGGECEAQLECQETNLAVIVRKWE